jgi:hypothetical protein
MTLSHLRFLTALAIVAVCAARSVSAAGSRVDFDRDVLPIFRAACSKCHGPEKSESQLRLHDRSAVLKGGVSGAVIVPGQPEKSLLFELITDKDADLRMPKDSPALSNEQIEIIRRWIEQGAEWPEAGQEMPDHVGKHWAYIKPVRPKPPSVKGADWLINPIDNFVLARLEQEGLEPSPEASRESLVRRLSLDLIGLPPSIQEVDAFLRDTSAGAYETLVDRLLASPHYGERWAQPWLDAARYADSNGLTNDRPRTIWPYRDWVINALNDDMPFDKFTIEQIAGDLLPNSNAAQQVATGFNRNTLFNDEQGVDQDEARWNVLVDRVGTTATVWLGTTMACAQCHNHKYDPFSQTEFYRLLAFFENGEYAVEGANYDKHYIEPQLDLGGPQEKQQRRKLENHVAELKAKRNKSESDIAELEKAKDDLAEFLKKYPATLVMRDRPSQRPLATFVRVRGNFLSLGDEVPAGVPAALHQLPAGERVDRLALARWLVSTENPLTARVVANRQWSQLFGHGIVETEEDFGTRGAPPSHPELLDWLATELMSNGWSLKNLHKTIVMSATYRQSSRATPELLERDPHNHRLTRGPRFRLDAEQVRDMMLSVSGLLCARIGGPSVFPPQPETTSIGDHGGVSWVESTGEDRYRRGLYIFWRRSALYPALANFDAPSRDACTVRRLRTNTPLQALTLLNETTAGEAAAALAGRIRDYAPADQIRERVDYGFRLCTSRFPTEAEASALAEFVKDRRADFAKEPDVAQKIAAQGGLASADADFAAWFLAAQALLNLDETLCKE